jgi:hypothetical protein
VIVTITTTLTVLVPGGAPGPNVTAVEPNELDAVKMYVCVAVGLVNVNGAVQADPVPATIQVVVNVVGANASTFNV